MSGWIGVDLDGTLAQYGGFKGPDDIGEPVPAMLDRVKAWVADGREVRIFTARVCAPGFEEPIKAWCEKHGIGGLAITNAKDFGMVELWDDRAVRVMFNKGEPCCAEARNEMLDAAVTKNALLADRIKELEAEVEKLEEYLSRVPAGMYL